MDDTRNFIGALVIHWSVGMTDKNHNVVSCHAGCHQPKFTLDDLILFLDCEGVLKREAGNAKIDLVIPQILCCLC